MKKVLLVVIDALATRVLLPALEEGRLPVLADLIARGVLRTECTSIFPSITPAATASIATGVYPVDHGIAGGFWYDREHDCVAYYGDDFWVVIDEGFSQFFNDFLVRLNCDRLKVDTLYQHVERQGLTAAAVNYMWFRGDSRHRVDAPWLFKMIPGISVASEVPGPKVLALADFAASMVPGRNERLSADGGLMRRFGFHDETTADYLAHLATADPFPDFTLAYFPNNDFASHADGPAAAVSTLEAVDASLGRFLEAMGGMDRFLREFAILITGDHSQSDLIGDRDERGIDLEGLLNGYQLAKAGRPWENDDDVMVCPNMRSCHIYLKDRSAAARDKVIERLLSDRRVDQVFWRSGAWDRPEGVGNVDPCRDTFHVAKAEFDTLTFRRAERDTDSTGHDSYGTSWECRGDLQCVGAFRADDGRIRYREYPNALERIATGFCQNADDLWVTARLGHEFKIAETSIHNAGSHGALNRDDSTAPLIVAGSPEGVQVPEFPRTIDVAPLCLRALGLDKPADHLIRFRIAGRPR